MISKKIKVSIMTKQKSSGHQDAVFSFVQKTSGNRVVLMPDFSLIRRRLIFAGDLLIQEKRFIIPENPKFIM